MFTAPGPNPGAVNVSSPGRIKDSSTVADSNSNAPPSGGVDPVMGFWRDVWARSAATAGMPGGTPGATPGFVPPSGFGMPPGFGSTPPGGEAFSGFTPEAMRRMQAAFFEAMAQHAEQWMKSPQFLESMKRTMDRALDFRRQMDDFLQSNMASAFETATGGANTEIMGAIRHSTAQIQTQMEQLGARLDEIESRLDGVKPSSRRDTASSAGAEASSPSEPGRKSGSRDRRRTSGKRGSGR